MQHDPTIKIYNDMRSALPTLPGERGAVQGRLQDRPGGVD